MSTKMKFKCTSCQHIFEHDAYQKECFCPKCGNISERCAEEEQFIVCSECGTEIPNGVTSCPTCGCPISATKNRHCHECGAELADSVYVCPQCGCPVVPATPIAASSIPPVSITQTASPIEVEEQELSLPPRSRALYWFIGGIVLVLLVSFGIFYYTTDYFKDKTNTLESVVGTSRQVVIDGVNLRLRYAPSSDAETYQWADGTNRHPEKGERFPYLGEVGDFYKVDYKGLVLYVSKQHTHLE